MAIRMYLSAFRPPLLGLDRFLQIWPKLTRRQPLRRVKSPRPQLFQHVLRVPQLVLEYRHVVPDPLRRMTIARPDASLPEHLRHLQRELVLARRRPAVRHLDLIDELEHRHALGRFLRGHLKRRPAVPPEVNRAEKLRERG